MTVGTAAVLVAGLIIAAGALLRPPTVAGALAEGLSLVTPSKHPRVLIVLIAIAVGCAPLSCSTSTGHQSTFPPATGPPATLYIFNQAIVILGFCDVYDNGEKVARIGGQKYVRLSLPSGHHHLTAAIRGSLPIDLEIQPGSVSYVLLWDTATWSYHLSELYGEAMWITLICGLSLGILCGLAGQPDHTAAPPAKFKRLTDPDEVQNLMSEMTLQEAAETLKPRRRAALT